MNETVILFIEPFYGGSHKQLLDTLVKYFESFGGRSYVITLPAKKWQWRARTSALYISQIIPFQKFDVLFASSVLNLAELVALRPDLLSLHKILYFHENQLVYPVRKHQDRDFQYGYNQILSCLVGDTIIFNSNYNKLSFLDNINNHLHLQPDYCPKNIRKTIELKSKVLYFPLEFPKVLPNLKTRCNKLHIVWPHRWEHDKNPEMFFNVLYILKQDGLLFQLSVLGESFKEVPSIFNEAKEKLSNEKYHWGKIESKEEYFRVLGESHVVVSTALHEFYGVSMLEAVYQGCFPLVPDSLVYPEIYPPECRYKTSKQLYKKLKMFCSKPFLAKKMYKEMNFDVSKFEAKMLLPFYRRLVLNK